MTIRLKVLDQLSQKNMSNIGQHCNKSVISGTIFCACRENALLFNQKYIAIIKCARLWKICSGNNRFIAILADVFGEKTLEAEYLNWTGTKPVPLALRDSHSLCLTLITWKTNILKMQEMGREKNVSLIKYNEKHTTDTGITV